MITTGEWLLGDGGDCCLGPTDNSVGVWSRADFTALQRRSDFTINHQLFMSGCGWRPRTDAAKCDTHFYVLFQLGNNSLEDLVIGVIDTIYTGFDFRTYLFICSRRGGHCLVGINGTNRPAVALYYLLSALGIYAYDESVDVRWSYTTLVRWISEADDHRREIVLAGRQPVRRCILLLVLITFVI